MPRAFSALTSYSRGIRAGVARSLVRLGVVLSRVNTRKTLHEGIALAVEHLRVRETKAK
jgi:hypothetical protein